MAPLKIIIVGAGIAGPAAAIDLARSSHDVTIYERSSLSTETGYAFRITANSDRCLKYLGIDTIAGGAVAPERGIVMNAEGQVLHERLERTEAEKEKNGTGVFAYRPGLHKQLMETAHEFKVKTKLGAKVIDVDVAKTTITLEGGEQISADLIIAADGVQSVVRPYIIDTSQHFPRASSGHNAFRFMVSKSLVRNDGSMSSLVKDDANMFSWAGVHASKRIIVYPVDHDKQFNVVCTHPEELSDKENTEEDEAAAVAYNQKASIESVLSIYGEFEPRTIRLLKLADPEGFRIWKLTDMDETPHWSSNHTTLLGDACHPVLPFGFSGASMGIEDALTLSTLLPSGVETKDIPNRLQLYENIRRPRVATVRDTSRDIARGLDDRQRLREYFQFLTSHDAVKHAQETLEKHLKSSE